MEGNFNKHLGSKLRMRRLALGLTQTKVAQAINVTFQQIQKYEKGTNGISSLRIMQLANFLKVPVGAELTCSQESDPQHSNWPLALKPHAE